MWLEAHYHEAEKLRGRPLGNNTKAIKANLITTLFVFTQVLWTNTEFERSFRCLGLSGTANRKRTASKNVPAAYSVNGIFKIRTQTLLKSASLRLQPVWHQLKSEIGLKIDDNVIEPLLKRIGKLFFINTEPWCFESRFLKRSCRVNCKQKAKHIIN